MVLLKLFSVPNCKETLKKRINFTLAKNCCLKCKIYHNILILRLKYETVFLDFYV